MKILRLQAGSKRHDASLTEGFELVTHPMSLTYHCRDMPWQDVMRSAVRMGYRSHQTDTCGLHVHVSRDAFGDTEEEQDAAIARLLYFFEKYWEELLKFSRRTAYQMEQWAARYGYKDRPKEILDHAKKGYSKGRYSSINLQNRATIEFRIFRGTLKYNTLIATLQFIDQLCDLAITMTDQQMQNLSWTTLSRRQKTRIVRTLAELSEERGTDAAGIAYNSGGKLHIDKHPGAAHTLPRDSTVVMGHTQTRQKKRVPLESKSRF